MMTDDRRLTRRRKTIGKLIKAILRKNVYIIARQRIVILILLHLNLLFVTGAEKNNRPKIDGITGMKSGFFSGVGTFSVTPSRSWKSDGIFSLAKLIEYQ